MLVKLNNLLSGNEIHRTAEGKATLCLIYLNRTSLR